MVDAVPTAVAAARRVAAALLLLASAVTLTGLTAGGAWVYGRAATVEPLAPSASPPLEPTAVPTDGNTPAASGRPTPTPNPQPEPDVSTRVTQTLAAYFGAINRGDYPAAYALLGPQAQAKTSYGRFADGLTTSQDTDVQVFDLNASNPLRPVAWVTFTSRQAPEKGPDGLPCARWSMDYEFLDSAGQLLIDSVSAHGGGDAWAPCG